MRGRITLLFSFAISIALAASTQTTHGVERRIRQQFPSIPFESGVTLDSSREFVGGRMITGFVARESNPLRVFFPMSYDAPFVAQLDDQRVAIRAIGAHPAIGTTSAGRIEYASTHASVDILESPGSGRSEEFLVLNDVDAPRTFEFEIVEMQGVADVRIVDGAIRFVSDHPAAAGRFSSPQPAIQIDRPWVVDANGKRSESAAHWTIIEKKDALRTIRLTIDTDGLAYPLVVDPTFSVTGNLVSARYYQTFTLLPTGKVLIAGGYNGSYMNSAELYEPATGAFTAAPNMTVARGGHSATLLPSGKVLIAGGFSPAAQSTAELYDPIAGTFTATGSMATARGYHTATLLESGTVLIAGGYNGSITDTVEVYVPGNGQFSSAGTMNFARAYHTATTLQDGSVLFAGGLSSAIAHTFTAEVYVGNGFTRVGDLIDARSDHTATLLPSGEVLIAGGQTDRGIFLSSAELYDPGAAGFSSASSLATARSNHTATLLPNGTVLITGGRSSASTYLDSAEIYDPDANAFTSGGTMTAPRRLHSATLLPNGKVLIAAGYNSTSTYLNSAEVYDAAVGVFSNTGIVTGPREDHTATLLPNGKVLLAGSLTVTRAITNEAWLYDFAAGTYVATGNMTAPRHSHTATLLSNGKVLIAGGENNIEGVTASAELYDPATGTFTATGSMTEPRDLHTATLLTNGKVLITGGHNGYNTIITAELYDPVSGTFTSTGSMSEARNTHTATLLANRKVLVVGSYADTATDLYDPATGTFSSGPNLPTLRYRHLATLLPNGKVLIAGGQNDPSTGAYATTADLYDPVSNTFSTTGAPAVLPGSNSAATALENGKVLISGGYNGTVSSAAQLYDPASGTFTATASFTYGGRYAHTSTLLPNGKVLIASGFQFGFSNSVLELYDAGIGYSDARRAIVSTMTDPLCLAGALQLTGSGIMGDSEGSSGSVSSSPANEPLLRLQRLDNDQILFVTPLSFSATAFSSKILSNLPTGHYRASVYSNAIPGVERLINIATPPVVGNYPSVAIGVGGTVAVSPSSLPGNFNGNYYPLTATASAGFTGTLSVNGTTGVVNVGNARPAGSYTITVSATTSCGSASTSFFLDVGIPINVIATAMTPTSVSISWDATFDVSYEVLRIAAGGTSVTVGSTIANGNTASLTDNNASPNTAYLYEVRSIMPNSPYSRPDLATTVIFTDPTLTSGSTFIKAVHFMELRTAVAAVRTLAGQGAVSFTDPTLVAASTKIKAAHLIELRSVLDSARSVLGLPALTYVTPTITGGTTVVMKAHINDLRNGVQ